MSRVIFRRTDRAYNEQVTPISPLKWTAWVLTSRKGNGNPLEKRRPCLALLDAFHRWEYSFAPAL